MALNVLPANGLDAYNVLIFPATTISASSTGVNDGTGVRVTAGVFMGVSNYTSVDLLLVSDAGTGTSPTLNFYLQKLMANGTTWCDVCSFTQVTTAAVSLQATLISAVTASAATTDGTLAAASNKLAHMGSKWRCKYVVGGTNPSFPNVTLYGNFYA